MEEKHSIPSAGPWITEKEVAYVTDAVKNGWYEHWSDYIDKLEKTFAEYIGVKHAIGTSSCTGAITIIARALDLKPGDEIIVPEITWIASVSPFCHLGVKPVFVDVDKETWCIDPTKIKEAITPKTKAIMSVDMYGHPSDKEALLAIAHEANIPLIEDAAPGIGSKYKGKMVGSFGLASAFSFQGAKPLVAGEGGMIVTDDDAFYEKCYYFWDHCRSKEKVLYNTDVGYKFKLSGVQAALALAQVERADEIINKRRSIFFWYKRRLDKYPFFQLNAEKEGCYNNFYVPSIIVGKESPVTAEKIMQHLDEHHIGNRPFFRPLSKLPMFAPAQTPVADYLGANGINLPCASIMTEEQVEYVCDTLDELL